MSVELSPRDEHNLELLANVRPDGRENPEPADVYDLVVIGAGTAGLVSAAGTAGLGIGAKVALVERNLLGGDCLNVGCVPSKALIRCARAAAELQRAEEFGVRVDGTVGVDFPAVMGRMRRLRAGISPHDSVKRFTDLGIDVFLGDAAFAAGDAVGVAGKKLRFKKAIIATGGRPLVPPIDGLEDAGYLTNESVFNLTELPARLGVIGGGPIGSELAQAFARFGSRVTVFESNDRLLSKEDPRASQVVTAAMEQVGVTVRTDSHVVRVEKLEEGLRLHREVGDSYDVDAVLVAVGRVPNVAGLGLEAAGVAFDEKAGVTVDDFLRTTNGRILAAGDCCTRFKFTHAADALARIAIKNGLFNFLGLSKAKASALLIPRCTYTDPEVAAVGLTEAQAAERNIPVDVYEQELHEVDRATLDGEAGGFLKVVTAKGKDRILGATMVAAHAGESISEVTLAMQNKVGLGKLAGVIHPYPTQAEAIKKVADAYRRTKLTGVAKFGLKVVKKMS